MEPLAADVVWDIVEEHLDEAEFGVEQWLRARHSVRVSHRELRARIEPRLVAHLEGLRVAGPVAAQRLLVPLLAEDTVAPRPRVVAAMLALGRPCELTLDSSTLELVDSSQRARIERDLVDPSMEIALPALRRGLIGQLASAWKQCRLLAEKGVQEAWAPLAFLGGDLSPLIGRLSDEKARPALLHALSTSGRVDAAEVCLRFVASPKDARVAFEAFTWIVGGGKGIHRADPGPSNPLPPLEEDLANPPGEADTLPLPDLEALDRFWTERKASLRANQRYLRGEPYTSQAVALALDDASLLRREELRFELAVRSKGAVRIPSLVLGLPPAEVPAALDFQRALAWR